MKTISLTQFDQLELILEDPFRRVYRALETDRGAPVRLTIFSRETSQHVDFRRSLKTDLAMLESLQHQAVPRFLGAGESEESILFWTEDCGCDELATLLKDGRFLSAEDVIEIGWQVCSALQQAHNFGLSHGGMTEQSILISGDLRVLVVDFGVARWLDSMTTPDDPTDPTVVISSLSTVTHWRREVATDLKSLASVLQRTVGVVESKGEVRPGGGVSYASLLRMLDRILQSDESTHPVSARDVQGRLGELLIGSEDDKIELVDQRGQSYRSSRSIVEELFDEARPATEPLPADPPTDSAENHRRPQKLLVFAGVAFILLLLILAAAIW